MYEQYLSNIRTVAVKVSTPAEAFNLCEYVRNTIPDATGTDFEANYAALSLAAEYWGKHGIYDDGLAPAVAILSALNMFSQSVAQAQEIHNMSDLDLDLYERTNFDGEEIPDMTYPEFCDKYAQELNA